MWKWASRSVHQPSADWVKFDAPYVVELASLKRVIDGIGN